jgi:ribosome-associated translation inhibitor RaiA
MHIQVNTDDNVHGGEDLAQRVRLMIENSVGRFSDRITRIEAHLTDENGTKGGANDKRCMLEARLTGLDPLAVTHLAASMQLAIDGATEKLEKALEHKLGRLADRS